jgi:hypothetical protein
MTVLMIVNAIAGGGKEKKSYVRTIEINNAITKIIISGNVEVALTEDKQSNITIEGKREIAEQVRVVNEKGQLQIFAKSSSGKNRPKVTIPVSHLKTLVVRGEAFVYSSAMLHSDKINVLVDGLCTISLKSTGSIVVESTDEYYLKYSRNQKVRLDAINEYQIPDL